LTLRDIFRRAMSVVAREVIGTDRSADAVKAAQTSSWPAQCVVSSWQSRRHEFEHPFGAVVGRYVLLYNNDQMRSKKLLRRWRIWCLV
jgi:hypothetical protein